MIARKKLQDLQTKHKPLFLSSIHLKIKIVSIKEILKQIKKKVKNRKVDKNTY